MTSTVDSIVVSSNVDEDEDAPYASGFDTGRDDDECADEGGRRGVHRASEATTRVEHRQERECETPAGVYVVDSLRDALHGHAE